MRVNLFGGPGSGKSTTAAWLFSKCKEEHYSVEHCTEYVKAWAYANRHVQKYDQLYLFAKQQQTEYKFLSHGVKNIITDSPTILSAVYAKQYGHDLYESIIRLNEMYDSDYPSVNIFIDRKDKPYNPNGRWQTYEEAKQKDAEILDLLKRYSTKNLHIVEWGDKDAIYDLVKKYLVK